MRHEEETIPHEGGKAEDRLPRQAVEALSLAALKDRLAGALNKLIKWKRTLSLAGGDRSR